MTFILLHTLKLYRLENGTTILFFWSQKYVLFLVYSEMIFILHTLRLYRLENRTTILFRFFAAYFKVVNFMVAYFKVIEIWNWWRNTFILGLKTCSLSDVALGEEFFLLYTLWLYRLKNTVFLGSKIYFLSDIGCEMIYLLHTLRLFT